MNNIFKDQKYRLLLALIKKEITNELNELQGDIIHIKDAKNKMREFQSSLAKRVSSYFNHKSEYNGYSIRKIKTPFNSFTDTLLPGTNDYDEYFGDYLSKDNLKQRHESRIEELKKIIKRYYEHDYIKHETHSLNEWSTDSPVLTIPIHSIDVFRFNAISSQAVYENLAETGDASDYVISCMYKEISRINTWQYASNKFIRTSVVSAPLYSSMRSNYSKHQEQYIGFSNDFEMELNLPTKSEFSYGDLMGLRVKTNYKIPRLIGIACKKAASENIKKIDDFLGILTS